jgi:hypothetical protein
MSWTLLLFGGEKPPPAPDWPWDREPPVMGSPSGVRETINGTLPVVWFKDGWGQYGDDRCLLEFSVGPEEPVSVVQVKVRGLGAVQALLRLARNSGWYLVDGSSMELMTPENQPAP